MKMIIKFLTAAFFTGSILFEPLNACTGFKLQANDGSKVHGRTLEFAVDIDSSVAVVPRGYEFVGTTPEGPGLKYKAKYGAVGVIAFNNPAIMDGINEKGLAVGTFYFPEYASYSPITSKNQSKALSPIEFSNWILTQFATLEEVKLALPKVVIAPTVNKDWGSTPPPFHYIVYDKKGNALVIEPINEKLVAHDNSLGVITNSPTFDWHMANLRNYINLTPMNAKPIKLNNVELAPFGQGSGMVGMPGDFTPPSRFVRAAIYSATAIPTKSSEDAVFQAFHILNQFDIPKGSTRQKEQGTTHSDYTLVTTVRDPQTLKYYFKTYEDQDIKFVDLKAFDLNGTTIKQVNTDGRKRGTDISDSL
jgi:choloylglycine hydrolase